MSLGDYMGENLKKIRKDRGMTQIALQMQTGIEQALISKYETGERIPPTETLIILADFFNTNIDFLLDRTDNPEKIQKKIKKETAKKEKNKGKKYKKKNR